MPILRVQIVGPPRSSDAGLARVIADAAGDLLETPPARTWVAVTHLDRDAYAENHAALPGDVSPVLVDVLMAELPGPDRLRPLARRLTEAIATAADRPPANVHLFFAPSGWNRVSFGGTLAEPPNDAPSGS